MSTHIDGACLEVMANGELREFLYRPENFAIVDRAVGAGWLDGGCLILADALVEWLGGDAELYFLCGGSSGKDGRAVDWPEHALVRVGETYLDGDGASGEEEVLERWKSLEGLGECWLEASCAGLREAAAAGGMVADAGASNELARRLRLEFISLPAEWEAPAAGLDGA